MEMDRNRTDYNIYPMDFTNVGEEQTVSGEQNFRNRSPYSPGLFSPSQEFQGVSDCIPWTPGDSRTAHRTVPGTPLPTVPTTNIWGGFDGSNNWKDESFISSTPMSDTNQRQQDTNGIDHKWKKFVLRWTRLILQNALLFVVTLLITFLVSVIVKLFIDETSRRLEHFDNQNEDRRRSTDTVCQKLNFDQNIPHIRDNAKTLPVNSSSPLQVNRFEVQVKRTFSGSNDDVLADFLRYFENIATLNAWNEETNRRTKPKTLQEAVSSAMQEEEEFIRMDEGNINKVNRRNKVYTVEKESDVHEPNSNKNNYSDSHMNNRRYQNKRNRECTNCGKRGHTREYCWCKTHSNNQNIPNQTVPEQNTAQNSGDTVQQLNNNRSKQ
ncbi:unnamed protein product [Mytilus coruscus]|uniref:CCHC-type domain-containing protein n=1 Tax=Mytilus coruscus TaxID=42192 RepID=A0A6J8BI10_MYTCO|nr:unnamed protein product [Mytilus coruscus]